MDTRPEVIAVYGAGSWGTALALQLARNGLTVWLWGNDPAHVATLERERSNSRYLPGIRFPDSLHCEASLAGMATRAQHHLLVVPSDGFRNLLGRLAPLLPPDAAVVWATKGLERGGHLLHEVVAQVLPAIRHYGLVSGPTFAGEVARGLPTAMTVATTAPALSRQVADAFHGHNFRVYTSDDVTGVELGGVVKNVLAIAAGISDGLGFGANARAAIITRGLAEIMRLGLQLGARTETLMGLAGVGDLVLTCTDDQSRNRRLGLALGQGRSLTQAQADIGQAIEGIKSAAALGRLAARAGVEMPICDVVRRILYHRLPPAQAVSELIARDPKAEFETP
ncbi:MAG: NAD(P)-dependent glycerol-3-phosphate dehydrogenase [Thiothrix sp.]|nr:NAD(P)-dependent glycerol-3-phosphate dehydrogenase [Thiothrix sp.]HPQ95981.1 NAD(P)H-dependent glycerol-3-phosphate dehydrogenase [Thiolinea sp.]